LRSAEPTALRLPRETHAGAVSGLVASPLGTPNPEARHLIDTTLSPLFSAVEPACSPPTQRVPRPTVHPFQAPDFGPSGRDGGGFSVADVGTTGLRADLVDSPPSLPRRTSPRSTRRAPRP